MGFDCNQDKSDCFVSLIQTSNRNFGARLLVLARLSPQFSCWPSKSFHASVDLDLHYGRKKLLMLCSCGVRDLLKSWKIIVTVKLKVKSHCNIVNTDDIYEVVSF